ncbi:hypothetical protein BKA82DRAFT_4356173 [Pisolithus tinctorius]|nr:hypothetical protein BKA82DRAFT_4356173 [Pisolithus tinctorius]
MLTIKVACRYLIQLDDMNELLANFNKPENPEEHEDSDSDYREGEAITVNPIAKKVDMWTIHLTPEQQVGTPQILYHFSQPPSETY